MITGPTGIVEDMRAAARIQILAGIEQNKTPDQIARSLIGVKNRVNGLREGGIIGLTSRQVEFIIAAEAKLRLGDPKLMREYLQLGTRDMAIELDRIREELRIQREISRRG